MNHNENNSMKGNHSMKTSQIIICLAGLSSLFMTGCPSNNANLETTPNDNQISVETYTACSALDLGFVTKIWKESAKGSQCNSL